MAFFVFDVCGHDSTIVEVTSSKECIGWEVRVSQ